MHLVLPVIILAIAAVTDLRSHRIPNWLTYPAVVLGIGLHAASGGIGGCVFGLQGLFLGMGLLIVFYVLGGMGAGDVKLLGAVGSFLGPHGVFMAFLSTALVGGVLSLAVILRRRGVRGTTTYFQSTMYTAAAARTIALPEGAERESICYGVAIAIGSCLSMLVTYLSKGA
jgi:prepilin peptidase CpaA